MDKDETVSVSKGVFLFKNGFKKSSKPKHKHKAWIQSRFRKEPWYQCFQQRWSLFEANIKELHHQTYSTLLNDIVNYIEFHHMNNELAAIEGVIPTATLITGVNQPDHVSQFNAFIHLIRENVTPHIAMTNSQDGSTIKLLVENVVWQLINGQGMLDYSMDDNLDVSMEYKVPKLKKNQCTMKALHSWYQNICVYNSPSKKKKVNIKRPLIIIIPDFESFHCNVLQDFVMIVSSYISKLPIVLVFGVATSVSALHKSFPYHVSSKLLMKVFHSHSSPVYMNQVLENIFLTHTSPFHLSGKAFELLTDVFLFYDFSVAGLLQSIKYCMMDHYYGDNIKTLCCDRQDIDSAVAALSAYDLENVRQLMSFRPYLEEQSCKIKIKLFEDDNFFREILCKKMHELHDYLFSFYSCIRVLFVFIKDLPKNVLGKSVREIYSKCAIENITSTQAFRECMQLINFQSQYKLVESIKDALKVVNDSLQITSPIKTLRSTPVKNDQIDVSINNAVGETLMKTMRIHLMMFLRQIENANNHAAVLTDYDGDDVEIKTEVPGDRYKLKEKLLRATREERVQSEFELVRGRFASWLCAALARALRPHHHHTFHELVFFSDVASVKKQIVGAPRGAVHTALSDPHHYLQCKCCGPARGASVSGALPDVSLAYKLHRECGKHINLYDWLQAFAAVLHPADDEQAHQNPLVQARFSRAVAELQFLGFIKSSKRKTDHVMRLTW
ncbi:PREDICTED: origin recognition complex subunit 3 [Papilio polytes]|uniref:origin recognition complex subunit 3 n=1 Tax=Papilio polytes TaxID=76194 RepID=UPI00067675D6|nr:PREDICTED: origin recognition complex subunit 3 [Papilio polytes]